MSLPSLGIQRPLVVQEFNTRAIAVTAVAQPIDVTLDKTKLIVGWAINNPAAGASVYIGNLGVTIPGAANPGFEISPGSAPFFGIDQQGRQLYELQQPALAIQNGLECGKKEIDGIPFVVFDLSRWWIIAAGNTTVTLITLPCMYL